LHQQKAIEVTTESTDYKQFKKENIDKSKTYWFVEIPNLGFLKFFSYKKTPPQKSFNLKEIKKAEKIIERLSIALQSCLLHTRIIKEIEQKNKFKNEIRKLAWAAQKTDNAIIITDTKGVIEWVNDGFVRISGYSSEDGIGKTPCFLMHETDPSTIKYIKNQIKQENSFKTELLNYTEILDGTFYSAII
jgi:PAS domain S-box-containing protein